MPKWLYTVHIMLRDHLHAEMAQHTVHMLRDHLHAEMALCSYTVHIHIIIKRSPPCPNGSIHTTHAEKLTPCPNGSSRSTHAC